MTAPDLNPAEQAALPLARQALIAGIGDAWPAAIATVQRIGNETGGDGVYISLLAWIDAYVDRIGVPDGAHVAIAFQAHETGDVGTADQVPGDVAWAGRALAARAAGDKDTFNALVDALPDDTEIIGRHVMRVLHMCALGIRSTTGQVPPC